MSQVETVRSELARLSLRAACQELEKMNENISKFSSPAIFLGCREALIFNPWFMSLEGNSYQQITKFLKCDTSSSLSEFGHFPLGRHKPSLMKGSWNSSGLLFYQLRLRTGVQIRRKGSFWRFKDGEGRGHKMRPASLDCHLSRFLFWRDRFRPHEIIN